MSLVTLNIITPDISYCSSPNPSSLVYTGGNWEVQPVTSYVPCALRLIAGSYETPDPYDPYSDYDFTGTFPIFDPYFDHGMVLGIRVEGTECISNEFFGGKDLSCEDFNPTSVIGVGYSGTVDYGTNYFEAMYDTPYTVPEFAAVAVGISLFSITLPSPFYYYTNKITKVELYIETGAAQLYWTDKVRTVEPE